MQFQLGCQQILSTRLAGAIALMPALALPLASPAAIAQTIEQPIESGLPGEVWHLQEVQYSNDETLTIEESYKYTLEFEFDGRMLLRADCNFGSGNYTRSEDQLDLELGLLTRAACPPDSYSDRYLSDLSQVASYRLDDGDLYLSLEADGGVLVFSPTPTPIQPLPLSADEPTTLVGPVWNLVGMSYADHQVVIIDVGEYTLIFGNEGNVSVRADCNLSAGSYRQTGNQLTIALGPSTLAACPPQSLSDQYLRDLSSAETYTLQAGRLSIGLQDELGTLVFDVLEPTPY